MYFQDLTEGPQFLTGTRKPGRYVHVGDLLDAIEKFRRVGGHPELQKVNPEYGRGAQSAMDSLARALSDCAVRAA